MAQILQIDSVKERTLGPLAFQLGVLLAQITFMEDILEGTVVTREGSQLPYITFFRGDTKITVLPLVTQYDLARGLIGERVKFTLLKHPYGPDISSDHGFAKLLYP